MESHGSAMTEGDPQHDAAPHIREATEVKGVVKPSLERDAHRFLSDVIVELGFADRETVDSALDEERRKGKRMGRFLVEGGALTEQQLGMAIAERYELDYLDLNEFEVDTGAANLITQEAALRYETVPVGFREVDTLLIAIADPTDGFALNDIAVMTRLEVRPAVAARSDILALIERLPRSTRSSVVIEMPGANETPVEQVAKGEADESAIEPVQRPGGSASGASRAERAVEELRRALVAESDQESGDLHERLSKAEADLSRVRATLEQVKVDAVRERNEWVVSHQKLEEELRVTKEQLESARSRRS